MSRVKMSMGLLAFALMMSLGAGSALAGTIKGTVTGPDGKAVSGAKVRLMAAGADAGKPKADAKAKLAKADKPGAAAGEKGKGHGTPVAETETDATGAFKFENVADGQYKVVAMVKGVGGGQADVTVAGTGEASVSITLKEKKAK